MSMMSPLCVLVICFVLSVIPQGSTANDWWMEEPYGNSDFNYPIQFGQNETLVCNDTFLDPGFEVQYWILPDLVVMRPGDPPITFFTLDGNAGWVVDNFTGDLEVFILQEAHFGFYHCVMEDPMTSEIHIVKKAINFRGPYYGDLWPKYKKNTIQGGGAAGGFLVLAILLLLTCKFYYNEDEDDDDDEDDKSSMSSKSSRSSTSTGSSDASSIQKYVINDDPQEGSSSSSSSDSNVKKRPGSQGFTNEAFETLEKGDMITDISYASIDDASTAL